MILLCSSSRPCNKYQMAHSGVMTLYHGALQITQLVNDSFELTKAFVRFVCIRPIHAHWGHQGSGLNMVCRGHGLFGIAVALLVDCPRLVRISKLLLGQHCNTRLWHDQQ